MNKTFMHDLFFGNLVPWERRYPQDPAYLPLCQKISDMEKHFEELLSAEEYKRFEEMKALQAQSGNIEDVDLFGYGFCMATLMMMDVLRFRDSRLSEQESG